MTNKHTPPKDLELTLLALGTGYGLCGDRKGIVRRICAKCITATKLVNPVRVYIDNFTPELIHGNLFVLSEDIPRDELVVFSRYRDTGLDLGVWAAFDPASRKWYVREIADETGEPSGRFFFTGVELPIFDFTESVC